MPDANPDPALSSIAVHVLYVSVSVLATTIAGYGFYIRKDYEERRAFYRELAHIFLMLSACMTIICLAHWYLIAPILTVKP